MYNGSVDGSHGSHGGDVGSRPAVVSLGVFRVEYTAAESSPTSGLTVTTRHELYVAARSTNEAATMWPGWVVTYGRPDVHYRLVHIAAGAPWEIVVKQGGIR